MTHIGFSGTRRYLKAAQKASLEEVLASLRRDDARWLHHGDCVGADEQSHVYGLKLDYRIWVHPPIKSKHRAFCEGWSEICPPDEYLTRNQCIVNKVMLLVAAPNSSYRPHSGTWYTINLAMDRGIPIKIVMPSGLVEEYGPY